VKFVFRLESPLRLARHHEEAAKRAMGEAMGRLESRKAELSALRQELFAETAAQSAPRRGEIWAQGQSLFIEWTQGQQGKILHGQETCKTAQEEVEKARLDLVEKRRAVQVFERLRERRLAQWKLEMSRKELAEGSDVAGRRWMAQRRDLDRIDSESSVSAG